MGTFLKFGFLWWLTGSPLIALLILLFLGGVADWYAFGIVRRFYRVVWNLQRGARVDRELKINPANKKARFDLADVLVERGQCAKAIDLLKPLLAEEPGDLPALFLMGQACLGAKLVEQGELFLGTVESAEPGFRQGTAPLEIGRFRLARGDGKGAVAPLGRYLAAHPTSVEAHYLLSRALAAAGDEAGSRSERERTWSEYETSLPFQRRMDRLWAWRAKPSRPAIYAVILVVALAGASFVWQRAQLGPSAADVAQVQGIADE